MHVEERTIPTVKGESILCRIWSPDSPSVEGDAVLFLHGVESHSEWFSELAPFLTERGFTLYAPDRPGWGQSSGRRGHLAGYEDLLAMADRMEALIVQQCRRVHLVGLSWGGKEALYIALRRPHVFASLSLIAPGLCPVRTLGIVAKGRVAFSVLAGDGRKSISLPLAVSDFTFRKDRQAYIRMDPFRIREVTASFCLESLKMDRYIREEIGRLASPTQLLLAGKDVILDNEATRKLLTRADQVSLRTLIHPEAAHSLVFETPRRTADELAEWFARPPSSVTAPRSILIMGAGAVGSAVGGLLARGGHRVTLVAREAHAEAIRRDGLHVKIGQAILVVRENLTAVSTTSGLPAHDLVILCVKGFDTESALKEMVPLLRRDTVILSLQNGVQNEALIARAIPENPVLAGAICAYLSMDGPGKVHFESDRGGIAVAPHRARDAEASQEVAAMLRVSGLSIVPSDSGEAVKWSKLMLNVAFNAINALTGLGTAQIMSHPKLGPLAVATFSECIAVLKGRGLTPVNLPGYKVGLLVKVMALPSGLARRLVARFTRGEVKGQSSMAQDFARGRARTEIDEINGMVVQAGREQNRSCPANEHLVHMIQVATADPAMRQVFLDHPERVTEGYSPSLSH